MNQNITRLTHIAQKNERRIIGLMSGTSLDGLDVAVCRFTGAGPGLQLQLEAFTTVPYDAPFKTAVKAVFSKEMVNLQQLCLLNEWTAKQHAAIINNCLANWNIPASTVDLLASHGQTVYHAPLSLHGIKQYGNGTLQIGDGDHLAVLTGIITVSDFRQKHLAAGGEGAPLAAYGDYLIFREAGTDVILLNIGGIANITYLPGSAGSTGMFSSDTGPGNTMMDAWMQQNNQGKYFDEDAAMARAGKVNEALLARLMDDAFLQRPLPKTTGPELYNLQYLQKAREESGTLHLPVADVMATLNRFSAQTIVDAIQPLIQERPCRIYVSGGGMHNPVLLDYLSAQLQGAALQSTSEKNIDPDAKEAILFAILANECVAGNPGDFVSGINNFPATTMGKISFPW